MTHTRPKPNDRSRSDFGRALVFVALLFLSLCTQGYARELIADRAFVVDFSGTWTLEQAQRKPLTRFDGLLTGGYGSGTIWVRLKIEPVFSGSAANGPLFLRIRPMYLDDIRLFDEADGFKPRSPIGDRQSMSAQDEPAPFFLLKLRAGDTPRELWLRVESTSTRMVYFEVMDEAALRESKLKIQSLTSVYLTLIGLFLVIGFYQTVSHRDRLNASFSFYQIVAFINGMISFGYARWWADEWLSPSVLDRLFSINAVGFVLGLLFFSAAVLRELSHSRLRTFVFLSLSALPLGLIGMQFTGMIRSGSG